MIDDLEEKYGVKIDEMTEDEKATFFKMLDDVKVSVLTPEKMRDYITALREAVERDLVKEPEFNYIFIFRVPNRNQIMLKARLYNYLLLEAFLMSPIKAQQQLNEALKNYKNA